MVGAKDYFRTEAARGPKSTVPLHCHPKGDPTPSIRDLFVFLAHEGYPEGRFCVGTASPRGHHPEVKCYKKVEGTTFEELSERARSLEERIKEFNERLKARGRKEPLTKSEKAEASALRRERSELKRDIQRREDEIYRTECEY